MYSVSVDTEPSVVHSWCLAQTIYDEVIQLWYSVIHCDSLSNTDSSFTPPITQAPIISQLGQYHKNLISPTRD